MLIGGLSWPFYFLTAGFLQFLRFESTQKRLFPRGLNFLIHIRLIDLNRFTLGIFMASMPCLFPSFQIIIKNKVKN